MDRADLPEDPRGKYHALHLSAVGLSVYLVLAAQYESWSLPLVVILIVPMTLFFGNRRSLVAGRDNNVLRRSV